MSEKAIPEPDQVVLIKAYADSEWSSGRRLKSGRWQVWNPQWLDWIDYADSDDSIFDWTISPCES